jgi:cytochrome P450
MAEEIGTPPDPDWVNDFDHAHPSYNANAPRIWDDLRSRCPVAHTDRYGGAWLPVRHAEVSAVAYDTENFTSHSVVVSNGRPPEDTRPVGAAPPITSDPPFHHPARRVLLPPFAPRAIDPLEPEVRALCRELLDRLGPMEPGAVFDAAVDYAQHIPVHVIARMLGFPVEDAELFRGFIHDVLEAVDVPIEQRIESFEKLRAYIAKQVAEHRLDPRDDLTSYLLDAELDGEKLTGEHVGGTIILLLIAGIDTTWSAIGSSLWHLAGHRGDLDRLVAEGDSLMTTAIEELLRAFAPVTMARLVQHDTELAGRSLSTDEWVLLPFPAANRDPAVFDRPDEVILDREVNRHVSFGLGIHRCLGSNLARMEVRVAVEEFLARFPEFELADPSAVSWSVGQVRGPRRLPVRVLRSS